MKLFPELNSLSTGSSAEMRIASLLGSLSGSESDFAYHSFALNHHEYKKMSEIDFVIAFNGSIIILEVKGGRIQREEGLWKFTNRYNESNFKSEGPWEQARSAMFAFKSKVAGLIPNERISYTYMVATPDSDLSQDVEHEPWQWLGPRDMTPGGIQRKFEAASREARRQVGWRGSASSPIVEPDWPSISKLRRILTKKIDGKVPLNDHIVGLDHERLLLTDKQLGTIKKLFSLDRVTISGGAGTGKTVIAAECARHVSARGTKVAFVCQSDGVLGKVRAILADTDVAVVNVDGLVSSNIVYDLLIIDEGQDLLNDSDISKLDTGVRGGIIDGKWWIFLDENNQVLDSEKFDRDVFQDYILENSFSWKLDENLRNTKSIVTFVSTHLAANIGDPSIQIHGPSSKMKSLKNKSPGHLQTLVRTEIDNLITSGNIRLEDIWIISCKESLQESSIQSENSRDYRSFETDHGPIRVVTAHEVKGLEIPVTLVVDIEDLGPESISKVYVAFTRASIYMCAFAHAQAVKQMSQNLLQSVASRNEGQ